MKRWMQNLFLKEIRQAIETYELIKPGDRILVGISGGKDSSLLYYALSLLSQYKIYDFEVVGIMVNHGMMDSVEKHNAFFKAAGAPIILHKETFKLLSNEISPCYTCSRMRKGIIKRHAVEKGFNKIAFGHTKDDVAETFMMNIIKHGKIASIPPRTVELESGLEIIRPLIFLNEKKIISAIEHLEIPIVASTCEHAVHQIREKSEGLISEIEMTYPEFSDQVIKALGDINLKRTLVKMADMPMEEKL